MSSLGDWLRTYLLKLRADLHPDLANPRLHQAARHAIDNGWPPDQAAEHVNAANYSNARSPVVIALIELERVAETPPPRDPDNPIPAPGCGACLHGWIDQPDRPVTLPCPTCRPQLTARLNQIPQPGQRTPTQIAYLRHKRTG